MTVSNPASHPDEAEMVAKATRLFGGLPANGEITLVTVVKDGWFFMQSWLEHHRTIGVDRFLILDDGSSESFLDFLRAEQDVTVYSLPYRYGENVEWLGSSGQIRSVGAGSAYKEVFGNRIAPSRINFVLDSDEYLVIHPDFKNLRELLSYFDGSPATIFPAQMVDMLPESWPPYDFGAQFPSFGDLIDAHPKFLAEPAWSRRKDKFVWKWRVNGITRLFEFYRIFAGEGWKFFLRSILWWALPKRWVYPRSDINKIPILTNQNSKDRRGSHSSTKTPNAPFVMAVLHFTMTRQLDEKINFVLSKQGSYGVSKSRYRSLMRLTRKIKKLSVRQPMLKGDFATFEGPISFVQSGIFENYLDNSAWVLPPD